MAIVDPIIIDLVKRFSTILETCSGEKDDVQKVVDFLSQMLRTKTKTPPPAVELITILKHEKPMLYQMLKKAVTPTSPLNFVLQLDMNYEVAVSRIGWTSVSK